MNEEASDAMKTDARIALIMGWSDLRRKGPHWVMTPPYARDRREERVPPRYYGSLQAAMTVVDEIVSRGCKVDLSAKPASDLQGGVIYTCTIMSDSNLWNAGATRLSAAICEAVLRMYGA